MFSTFVIGLCLVLALVFFTVRPKATDSKSGNRYPLWPVGFVFLSIALIFVFFTCLTTVEAKQQGVLTTFGAPSDRTLDPGLSTKWPWQKVTEVDTTIQSDEYRNDDCITVKLGDNNAACVSTTNRWRPVDKKVNVIFQDYRSDDPTETLRDAVVSTQFKAAVNAVLGEYNPTAELDKIDPSDPEAQIKSIDFTPDYDELSQQLEDSMKKRLGVDPLVQIEDITISYIKLGAKTQKKIDDFQAEVAKTQIALQAQATATAQAKANRILADSLSKDQNVLVAQCLDMIRDGDLKPVVGFSCWPGGGTGIVLPQGR